MDMGADLDAVNDLGRSPLHVATISHSEAIVEELLSQGCDPSIKDSNGCSAVHYAARKTDSLIFNLLFPVKGCDIADKDKRGYGLLHYAVEGGNAEIVRKLLFRGASLPSES